jgi:hypothetical protein
MTREIDPRIKRHHGGHGGADGGHVVNNVGYLL